MHGQQHGEENLEKTMRVESKIRGGTTRREEEKAVNWENTA